jgi:hypothetical protein
MPEKQAGCLAEGPFQVYISDLVVCTRLALACRFMSAFHQSGVGDEVSHRWEAADVVNLVEDDQGQGFAYTGDASQQMNGHRVVFRNLGVDLPFDGEDLLMDGIHQYCIHFHTGADYRVCEAAAYAGTVRSTVDALFEVWKVVLQCWCSGCVPVALRVDEQGRACGGEDPGSSACLADTRRP